MEAGALRPSSLVQGLSGQDLAVHFGIAWGETKHCGAPLGSPIKQQKSNPDGEWSN
jgi:hypothetical protein